MSVSDPMPRFVNTQTANVLELFNSDLGKGVDMGVSHLLKQWHLDQLDSIYQRGQAKLVLPHGSVGTVKFTEKILAAGAREILQDPIKKRCDELYRNARKNIIWVDSSGQVDFKKNNRQSLPFGILATAQSAFEFLGQVRIRRLEPYESPSGALPRWVSLSNSIQVPYSADLAKNMPPGSEFEFSGEAKVNGKLELQLGIQATGKKGICILVQRLPLADKVMVKISGNQSLEEGLEYRNSYQPQWSFGMVAEYLLKYFGFLSWTQGASGVFEAKRQDSQRVFKQYILDLSDPEHQQAYENILTRCSIAKAEEVALKQEGSHQERAYELNCSATIADRPLTFLKISDTEKKARFNQSNYQESRSVREYISRWFSKMSVIWEWVSREDLDKKNNKSYCHVTFNSPYASDFFKVTDSLGISILEDAKKVLSLYPETEFNADIFFTDLGVINIQNCSFDSAMEAYLGEKISDKTRRYGEIKNKWFGNWLFWRELLQLEQECPELLGQAEKLKQAYAFARSVQPFKGGLSRFSDIKSIVTLMKLAGSQETLIHELALKGPGIRLSNQDEGLILHPEQEFMQEWGV